MLIYGINDNIQDEIVIIMNFLRLSFSFEYPYTIIKNIDIITVYTYKFSISETSFNNISDIFMA